MGHPIAALPQQSYFLLLLGLFHLLLLWKCLLSEEVIQGFRDVSFPTPRGILLHMQLFSFYTFSRFFSFWNSSPTLSISVRLKLYGCVSSCIIAYWLLFKTATSGEIFSLLVFNFSNSCVSWTTCYFYVIHYFILVVCRVIFSLL